MRESEWDTCERLVPVYDACFGFVDGIGERKGVEEAKVGDGEES